MRTLTRALAVATMATSGVVASAASADAASSTCIETSQAIGCFVERGDHVILHDSKKDGWTPRVEWETNYGRGGVCVWTGTSYWTDCNYNMKELKKVYFRLVLSNGHQVRVSEWRSATI